MKRELRNSGIKLGLVLGMLISGGAVARLGETESQLIARYGKPAQRQMFNTGEICLSWTNGTRDFMVWIKQGHSSGETVYGQTPIPSAQVWPLIYALSGITNGWEKWSGAVWAAPGVMALFGETNLSVSAIPEKSIPIQPK